MTLNSHFALNTVFRVESFSVDLRHDCFKIDGDAYTLSVAEIPRSVVSGDICLMPMFVGVR